MRMSQNMRFQNLPISVNHSFTSLHLLSLLDVWMIYIPKFNSTYEKMNLLITTNSYFVETYLEKI